MVKQRPLLDRTPPAGERLIVQKNGSSIIIPYAYTITDDGKIAWRTQEKEKTFAHGSTTYGDGKVDARKIKLSVYVKGKTQAEYEQKFNGLLSNFAGSDYTLICGREDRVYKVAAMTATAQRYLKGFKQRWSDVDLTLLLADPFRYASNPTVITQNYSSDQTDAEITFNNPSSVDVPLIWTFTPPAGGTVPSITITHVESGQSFTLKDTLLTNPAVAVVNAETGTVRRDTGNSLNTFAGIFLHALPGSNTYKYTGAACKVDITYTARWFV